MLFLLNLDPTCLIGDVHTASAFLWNLCDVWGRVRTHPSLSVVRLPPRALTQLWKAAACRIWMSPTVAACCISAGLKITGSCLNVTPYTSRLLGPKQRFHFIDEDAAARAWPSISDASCLWNLTEAFLSLLCIPENVESSTCCSFDFQISEQP